jgi:catechol 2,3-dioxygenase-like lactoylglutathione lyase family enzyme
MTANSASPTLNASGSFPSFTASDLEKSLHFYTAGLGFEIAERHEEDGKLLFASVQGGNARIGIGQDDFAKGRDRVKGTGVRIWISTDQDIHAIAARAKAAGITLDADPAPLPWGPMAFAVRDPDGFNLTISN